MLKLRVATAAVLLVVFLSAIFVLPTMLFAIPVAAVIGIGAYEWSGLAGSGRPMRLTFAASCVAIFAGTIWGAEIIAPSRLLLVSVDAIATTFWLLCVPAWLHYKYKPRSTTFMHAAGMVVILPAGLAMVSLHSIGPLALLLPLGLIWVADTAAYFAGKAFGRHKLAPGISPGKTWEGAAGAVAGSLIYAIICAGLIPGSNGAFAGVSPALFFAVVALLCVVSILGDLFESLMKRNAMVKDSGTLLPGHGGVLDRIDSITSTLPLAALGFCIFAAGT